MKVGVGIQGKFRIKREKADGTLVEEREFDNVVLDTGFDEAFSAKYIDDRDKKNYLSGAFSHLFLGTGASEPAASDSGLESRSGTLAGKQGSVLTSQFGGSVSATSATCYASTEYVYGEGEAEGVWTELGAASDDTYATPFNRSLFRDENGDPISLTVLSDEFLTVTLTVTLSFEFSVNAQTDYNGSNVDLSLSVPSGTWDNTDYYPSSYSDAAAFSGIPLRNIGLTSGSSNDLIVTNTTTTYSYDEATKTLTADFQIDPGQEETIGEVRLFQFIYSNEGRGEGLLIPLSPVIVKPADHRLTMSVSVQFSRLSDPA